MSEPSSSEERGPLQDPNADLALRAWQAASRSDVQCLAELCSQDLVWHASGRGKLSGAYRGLDSVFDYLARIGNAADEFSSALDEVLASGDRAAVLFRVSGRRGGRTLETNFILLMRIEGERIVEIWAVPRDQHAVDEFWA